MHTGKSYRLYEFLDWTRRTIYVLVIVGTVPVVLYQVFGLKWLAIPWTVVALLGTATAFIVGFKNVQTYNRMWEARQIWSEIAGMSRGWAMMCRDYVADAREAKALIYRHLAWLTALRFHLREPRTWETAHHAHAAEFARRFRVPERESTVEAELQPLLGAAELAHVVARKNKATQIAALQSQAVARLVAKQGLAVPLQVDLERALVGLSVQQSKSERIKDFPFPRQFATVSRLFIMLFCLLLPFGLLREFDKLNEGMSGAMAGNMIWLVVPFSVVISWMYTSLDQVGEATENPFEGGANDVPITQICRKIEVDLREMLAEKEVPHALEPVNEIAL